MSLPVGGPGLYWRMLGQEVQKALRSILAEKSALILSGFGGRGALRGKSSVSYASRALSTSSGCAGISKKVYEPGFRLLLGLKEVKLALDGAQAIIPSAETVRDNMQAGVDQDMETKDWSALAAVARHRAGLDESVAYS